MKNIIMIIISFAAFALFISGCSQTAGQPASPECGQCPQYMPPSPDFCRVGTLVPGKADECGCTGHPTCSAAAENECVSDSDCAKASCCHAKECTSKSDAPDCSGVACTLECMPETMDCGGVCRCVSGKCKAEFAT